MTILVLNIYTLKVYKSELVDQHFMVYYDYTQLI